MAFVFPPLPLLALLVLLDGIGGMHPPPLPQPRDPYRSVDDRIIRTPLQPLVDTATHILWDPNMLVTSAHSLLQLKTMFKQWTVTVPGVALLPFLGHHFRDRRDVKRKDNDVGTWEEDVLPALEGHFREKRDPRRKNSDFGTWEEDFRILGGHFRDKRDSKRKNSRLSFLDDDVLLPVVGDLFREKRDSTRKGDESNSYSWEDLLPVLGDHFRMKRDTQRKENDISSWSKEALDRLREPFTNYHYIY